MRAGRFELPRALAHRLLSPPAPKPHAKSAIAANMGDLTRSERLMAARTGALLPDLLAVEAALWEQRQRTHADSVGLDDWDAAVFEPLFAGCEGWRGAARLAAWASERFHAGTGSPTALAGDRPPRAHLFSEAPGLCRGSGFVKVRHPRRPEYGPTQATEQAPGFALRPSWSSAERGGSPPVRR